MAQDTDNNNETFDVALLGGQTEDGAQRVLRLRPEGASLGEVRPLKEGQPIQGEVVQLKPRQDASGFCDVNVLVPSRAPAAPSDEAQSLSHHGPARVASSAYRSNWETIFGTKKVSSELNLGLSTHPAHAHRAVIPLPGLGCEVSPSGRYPAPP